MGWCLKERSWNDWPHSALVSPGLRLLGEHEQWDCHWKHQPWILPMIQKFRLICVFSGVGFCVMIEIYLLIPFKCFFRPGKFLHYVNSCPVSPSQGIIFVTGAEEINIFCHKRQHQFESICSPGHQRVATTVTIASNYKSPEKHFILMNC